MKKRILITGGGSNLGVQLVHRYLESSYEVDILTSKFINIPNVNSVKVDWWNESYNSFSNIFKTLSERNNTYDCIIFNHNSGGMYNDSKLGRLDESDHNIWAKQHFISIQTLDILLKELANNITQETKIICLLSGIIGIYNNESLALKYPGYAGMKSSLLYNMLGYSKHLNGTYICINPGHMESESDYITASRLLFNLEKNLDLSNNGSFLLLNGDKFECTLRGV